MRLAILAAIALAAAFAAGGTPATNATSPPSADQFALDMKPHVAPANTAASIGPIHPCAALTQNGVLDADEIVIDTIEFDVVTGPLGIPAANPMTGYDYTLNWVAPIGDISIVSQTPLLIGTNPGSSVVNSSDSLPDSDGSWSASVSDSGPVPSSAETGPGVLDRLRLTTNGAASSGFYPLTLATASHTDTSGLQHTPDALVNGAIEIDSAGCGAYIDPFLESQTPVLPAIMAAGFGWELAIDGVVGNNGPDTLGLNATVTTTLTPPADCTVNGQVGATQVMNSVPVPQVWSTEAYQAVAQINCSSGGPHQISSEACVSTGANPDIDISNNCDTTVIGFDVDDSDTDGDGSSDIDEAGEPLCVTNPDPSLDNMDAFDDSFVNDGCSAVGDPEAVCTGTTDDDGDGIINDGCPQVGAWSEGQFNIGTDPLLPCGEGFDPGPSPAWPLDFVSGTMINSTDLVNVMDLTSFLAPDKRLNTNPGDPGYDPRWDLAPGVTSPFTTWLAVNDLTALLSGVTGFSPIMGDQRVFGGPQCTDS